MRNFDAGCTVQEDGHADLKMGRGTKVDVERKRERMAFPARREKGANDEKGNVYEQK